MRKMILLAVAVGFLLAPSVAEAAKWPTIPQSDWTLTEVAGHPNAAAVILSEDGTVFISEDSRSSYVDVYTRIKILTEEGTDYGSISLYSSDYMRTKNLVGRTHLPGGKVVKLSGDATFEKEFSDYYGTSIVSCAMPEVVPGAIVEYRYRTYFDSIFYQRMWYFQSAIPALESRVTYDLPKAVMFSPLVYRTLPDVPIDQQVNKSVRGPNVSYIMKNVPPLPDEPFRFPFGDLAARVMVLPTGRRTSAGIRPLFDSWKNTVDTVWGYRDYGYGMFFSDRGTAKKKAKALAAGAATQLAKASAIYRFIRDEVETGRYGSVWIGDRAADKVLSDRKGDLTEKALLLWVMLDAVKLDATVVWTNPRHDGRIEQEIPNPNQFFSVLVAVDIDGHRVFLDPTDRELCFGCLTPGLQGVPALLVTKKKQEWTTTNQLAAEESAQDAQISFVVDEDGGVAGHGTLELSGSHGWRRLAWKDSEEKTLEAWRGWLENRFSGYDIDDIKVTETITTSTVQVTWSMVLRDEEVLGDEVAFGLAAPLTVTSSPFTLTPNRRMTPVQLRFPDVDRVHLQITWPEGWMIDGEPENISKSNGAGDYICNSVVDNEARTLTIDRSLLISSVEFVGREPYRELRDLYATAVDKDAIEILLVAE